MSLLLDESPLVIQPKLAEILGLNESIVVQQLHYWVQRSKNVHNGKQWVFNTYAEWQEQFKFWSERTVIRIFSSLEKKSIIVSKKLDKKGGNHTKYYTINYEKLEELTTEKEHDKLASSNMTDCHDGHDKLASSICITMLHTENTTKTTTNNKKNKTSFPENDKEIKEYSIRHAMSSNIKSPIQTYESFKDYHKARGSKFVNWKSAFNTWIRNFFKYKTPNQNEQICLVDANKITGTYNAQLEEFKQDGTGTLFKINNEMFVDKVVSGNITSVGVIHA